MTNAIAGERLTVIGGGVIGLATARRAARAGARVTVLEARSIGGGATGAASGLVTLTLPGRSAFRRFKRAGYHATERLLAEIAHHLPPTSVCCTRGRGQGCALPVVGNRTPWRRRRRAR